MRRAGKRSTERKRETRAVHAPRASFEELEIRTEDGVALRAFVEEPPEGVALRGTCVMAHALFARKTEFGRRDRPGLAHAYAAAGWRSIAFDFRGHGDSTLATGARAWSYDDLVRLDLPAVVACARARSEDRPVVVLGHSLGAHTALAAQGTGRLGADALISVAGSIWLRQLEPSRLRWAAKLAVGRALSMAVARFGHVPARRLRMGSDDASGLFATDLLRFIREDEWRSADHRDDYHAALARVVVPVIALASDGDRLVSSPSSAERFARRCGGPVHFMHISSTDDGGRAPGHMAIVTRGGTQGQLVAALRWVERALEIRSRA